MKNRTEFGFGRQGKHPFDALFDEGGLPAPSFRREATTAEWSQHLKEVAEWRRSADRQALERSRARLRTLARMHYGALALIVVQALVIFGLVWSAR